MMAATGGACHHRGMDIRKPLVGALTGCLLVAALTACTPSSGPVIAPVTRDVGSLQGATVDLEVGQVLDIDTGDLAVDSYTGEVEDGSVARFVPGREEGGATYNPGVEALAAGDTTVVLSNSEGGTQDVTFTVEVSR
jgi:hypothetical protein